MDKIKRTVEIINAIYEMYGWKISDTIMELWLDDLHDKSINQIEHAFKLYRREYSGKPSLPEFLKRTLIPPQDRDIEPEPVVNGVPMPESVKKKISDLKKKMSL